jgi:hypothetical protein
MQSATTRSNPKEPLSVCAFTAQINSGFFSFIVGDRIPVETWTLLAGSPYLQHAFLTEERY